MLNIYKPLQNEISYLNLLLLLLLDAEKTLSSDSEKLLKEKKFSVPAIETVHQTLKLPR